MDLIDLPVLSCYIFSDICRYFLTKGLGYKLRVLICYLFSSLVGNIPYEATEEQLKDIFSEVGPVVSFR